MQYGVAQQIPFDLLKNGTMMLGPAMVTPGTGEAALIRPDDRLALQVYHRQVSSTVVPLPASMQFGDQPSERLVADMAMTVIGFTTRTQLGADDIEDIMHAEFPTKMPKDQVKALGLITVQFGYQSARFEAWKIYSEEYIGEKVLLKPHQLLFQLKYRIESTYRKGCFKSCGCEAETTPINPS